MLGGDDHGIDPFRAAILEFDRYLALAVRAQVVDFTKFAGRGKFSRQPVSQGDTGGEKFRSLISRIAEHHTLITGADGVQIAVMITAVAMFKCCVDPQGDVYRLLVERDQNGAVFGIQSVFCFGITDVRNRIAGHTYGVDLGR